MKGELEEYKAKKALEKKMKTTVIFDPRERNEWKYLLQLLIEKIENSENQWKPGANVWIYLWKQCGR